MQKLTKCINLNLGCGRDWAKHKGFDGFDIYDYGQKYVSDLAKDGLKTFEDNSVCKIIAYYVFEHLSPDDAVFVMNECYRVLVKGGEINIKVPEFPNIASVADFTHKSFWHTDTFTKYLCGKSPRNAVYEAKKWRLRSCDGDGKEIITVMYK